MWARSSVWPRAPVLYGHRTLWFCAVLGEREVLGSGSLRGCSGIQIPAGPSNSYIRMHSQLLLMKAMTMVSAVIFLAITISIMALIYNMGSPVIEKMQQSASLGKMKIIFSEIDEKIQEVASEGNGSRRVLDMDFTFGRIGVDSARNILLWEAQSRHILMLPRTAEYFGNMVVGSNMETSVYEGNYKGGDVYVLENSHLRVYLKKVGSKASPVSYSMNDVLMGVYQKDLGEYMPIQSFDVTIDDDSGSSSGTGYTHVERTGDLLPYGTVTAHMESTTPSITYSVRFTLESGTDFLKIEGSL